MREAIFGANPINRQLMARQLMQAASDNNASPFMRGLASFGGTVAGHGANEQLAELLRSGDREKVLNTFITSNDPTYQKAGLTAALKGLEAPKAMTPYQEAQISLEKEKMNRIYDPRYIEAQKAIRAAGRTTVNVNNSMAQEKEEDKTVGKAFGQQYVDLQKAGLQADSDIAKYDRLNNLLDQVNTGKFTGTTTQLKSMAKGMGVDLNDLGVPDDVAPAEAARSLSNQLSLELRNPAGGAGMPGAMSDADREFLTSMVPNLETTPQGRKLMIEYKKRVSKRNKEVAQLARQYRQARGMVDEGFFDVLANYSAQNPLFTRQDYQKVQGLSSGGAPTSAGGGARIRFDANGNMVQ